MPRHLHVTKFIFLSFGLHALMVAAVLLLIKPWRAPEPSSIPVNIVNLPPQEMKKLPPLERPVPQPPVPKPAPRIPRPVPPPPPPARPVVPDKPLPPSQVPKPRHFGADDSVKLPKTLPRTGVPEGAEQGKETGKTTTKTVPAGPGEHAQKPGGPLPFLTQNDIDQLARKGMPERSPGDDSVTLDTDEFKFISYNRWLKIKVESVLKYPELAAVSGYQGTVFIKFDIMKNGSLGGFEVLKSSGYKILDDEAERSIRSSAPFQPLPNEWKMDRYSIRAAVIFYLGEGYIR